MMRLLLSRPAILALLQTVAAMVALLLAGWPGLAAASSLLVPDYPAARQGCAPGWQIAARVAGYDSGAAYMVEAAYDPALGTGRLIRLGLSSGDDAVTPGKALWDAAAVLDGSIKAGQPPPSRRIFTLAADGRTLPFEWSQLDPPARAALDPAGDGLGEARVGFLRGERDREGAPFRRRGSLLGDIIRSQPLLIGAPAAASGAVGAPGYAAFYQRYRDREKLLWVGAGDGMLHAFDWRNGKERFAYIPSALLPAMPRLADTGSARMAVDGSPGQGEVLIDGQWRTALASGMGMSARGLFALEVTDPERDLAALWEFTERDDAAMGFVQAPPLFVKLRITGAGNDAAFTYRYFVLTSNGLNAANGEADGVLFLLALDKPAGSPWRHGENYYRLRARARDAASPNALAPPVLTTNADGSAHYAYAGDLQGTMWRFDLETVSTGTGEAAALFRARDGDGAYQAIAEAAQAAYAPGGGFLVLFGTGRAIESADFDRARFAPQSFYAVRDNGLTPLVRVSGRNALVERKLIGQGTADGFLVAGARFDYNGAGKVVKHGWFFDYARSLQDGERSAAAPVLAGSSVIVTSTAPGSDRCAPIVRNYVLDSLTGMPYDAAGFPVRAYLNSKGGGNTGHSFISRDGTIPLMMMSMAPAGAPDTPVATPTGAINARSSIRLVQFSGAGAIKVLEDIVVSRPAGRLSWREIVNWPELHRAVAPAGKPQ